MIRQYGQVSGGLLFIFYFGDVQKLELLKLQVPAVSLSVFFFGKKTQIEISQHSEGVGSSYFDSMMDLYHIIDL